MEYEFKACFFVEHISDFISEIESISKFYNEEYISVSIIDNGIFVYIDNKLVKNVSINIENLDDFFRKDIVCIAEKGNKPVSLSNLDLFYWSTFVDDTKVTSGSNGKFIIYHCYAHDMLFLLSRDKIPIEQFTRERLSKREFDNLMNEKPAYSENRHQHMRDLIEDRNVDDFFND